MKHTVYPQPIVVQPVSDPLAPFLLVACRVRCVCLCTVAVHGTCFFAGFGGREGGCLWSRGGYSETGANLCNALCDNAT